MRHIYAYAVAAAVIAALAAGWYRTAGHLAVAEQSRDTFRDALKEAGEQRRRDTALLARRSAAAAQAAREAAALRIRLQAALDANKAWADQPVPQAVQEALQ